MAKPTNLEWSGVRVSRPVFLDDGTWARKGDKCLAKSPLRHGTALCCEGNLVVVKWDDGKEERYFPHGINRTEQFR